MSNNQHTLKDECPIALRMRETGSRCDRLKRMCDRLDKDKYPECHRKQNPIRSDVVENIRKTMGEST